MYISLYLCSRAIQTNYTSYSRSKLYVKIYQFMSSYIVYNIYFYLSLNYNNGLHNDNRLLFRPISVNKPLNQRL
jgi:hypothetical protein